MNSSVGIGAFLGRWLVGPISSSFLWICWIFMKDQILFIVPKKRQV